MHTVLLMLEQEKPDGLMRLPSENPPQWKRDASLRLKVGQREDPNVRVQSCSAFMA